MIYVFLADGFEEVEAMAPVDILRRTGKEVITVSVGDGREVTSAHGVTMIADTLFADNDYSGAELVVLPGGMPGASNLAAHEGLCSLLKERHEKGELIGAICASPAVVLAPLGILDSRKGTCYPGFEGSLPPESYTGKLVEADGHVITGEGPAAALPFGYKLAELTAGAAAADGVANGMLFGHLMA
ncbi:MAG: DJ-1/PfpI family protein [Bacteroidales bacterium]|nr:DJ-1/PfpI family protein [Bacteroidales bacterium]